MKTRVVAHYTAAKVFYSKLFLLIWEWIDIVNLDCNQLYHFMMKSILKSWPIRSEVNVFLDWRFKISEFNEEWVMQTESERKVRTNESIVAVGGMDGKTASLHFELVCLFAKLNIGWKLSKDVSIKTQQCVLAKLNWKYKN